MTGKKRVRRKGRRTIWQELRHVPRKQLLKWMGITFLCLYLMSLIYDLARVHEEKYQVQQVEQQLQQKKEQLEKEKEQLEDPNYVESVARDSLGLVKPGEVPYVK